MTPPRAIIFDFGNVLDYLDDPSLMLEHQQAVAATLHLTREVLWSLLYNSEPWELCKRGKISPAEYWNRILTPLGITDPDAQAEFERTLFEGAYDVNPDMRAILTALRPQYRLAVLSNTHNADMDVWLVKEHGLAGMFETVVSSAKVGLAKPEPEIYRLTLERLGLSPGEALFVDDMQRNTDAAEAVGLPSIRFESPAQLRREFQARGVVIPQES